MEQDRTVTVCRAAARDLEGLLPRTESRLAVIRHAQKLKVWTRGSGQVLDLSVVPVAETGIFELCVTDCFGYACGLKLAFFEDVLFVPDGRIWIIGTRRDTEHLSDDFVKMLQVRKKLVDGKS